MNFANFEEIDWEKINRERDTLRSKITRYINGKISFLRYDLLTGLKNFWKFRKVIFQDRWWDYSFLNEMILFKLRDMESHWGNDTHYVGDKFGKLRLQILIKRLETLEDDIDKSMMKSMNEGLTKEQMKIEYNKLLDNFYKTLGRNIRKYWD